MGADIAIAVPLRPLGMVGAGHAPLWQYFAGCESLELICAPKGHGPPNPASFFPAN
jgi:hypothetical protein